MITSPIGSGHALAPLLRIVAVEKVYQGRQGPVQAVASASLDVAQIGRAHV